MQGRILPPRPSFKRALKGQPEYGPVYFVQNSEPYMTIAYPIEQFAGTVIGVLQAEVNLKIHLGYRLKH